MPAPRRKRPPETTQLAAARRNQVKLGIPSTGPPRAFPKETVAPIREPGASAKSFKSHGAGDRREEATHPRRPSVFIVQQRRPLALSPQPFPKTRDSLERKIRLFHLWHEIETFTTISSFDPRVQNTPNVLANKIISLEKKSPARLGIAS